VAEEASSYDRLLDAVVHAPIGFALYARDTAPGFLRLFVARGRQEVERRRRQADQSVTQAKTIGRFAVAYGPTEIRRRLDDGVERVRDLKDGMFAPSSEDTRRSEPATDASRHRTSAEPSVNVETATPAVPRSPSDLVAAADMTAQPPLAADRSLPIPDYDALSASQVVERLDGLAPPDLDAIAAYERERRGRRTILGKIEQLTA